MKKCAAAKAVRTDPKTVMAHGAVALSVALALLTSGFVAMAEDRPAIWAPVPDGTTVDGGEVVTVPELHKSLVEPVVEEVQPAE